MYLFKGEMVGDVLNVYIFLKNNSLSQNGKSPGAIAILQRSEEGKENEKAKCSVGRPHVFRSNEQQQWP